jgi:hypothetical protein
LLDQGFPKPPGFAVRAVDHTVDVVHLHDFASGLAEVSTPDWMIYCVAAQSGFHALVTRDRAQVDELAEMYVLSRLQGFTVITWRKAIEDPLREWGQLLAYLPEVKKRLEGGAGRVLLLPAPVLTAQQFFDPTTTLGVEAKRRGISNKQARDEAKVEIQDWLRMTGQDETRFDALLGH